MALVDPIMVKFRKTREQEWAAFGPEAEVQVGRVRVSKANGTVATVEVERVSRPFMVDGVPYVYGFLAPKKAPEPKAAPKQQVRAYRPSKAEIMAEEEMRAFEGAQW